MNEPKKKRKINRENWEAKTSVSFDKCDLKLLDTLKEDLGLRTRTAVILHSLRRLQKDEISFDKKFNIINDKLDAVLHAVSTLAEEKNPDYNKKDIAGIFKSGLEL